MDISTVRDPVDNCETIVVSFTEGTKEDVEAREHFFQGPLADWAEYRAARFSDYIVPKHLYIRQEEEYNHSVAWIYHAGVDVKSNRRYQLHHVVCECIRELEFEQKEDELFGCEALKKVLGLRAKQKSDEYGIAKILLELTEFDETKLEYNLSKDGRDLIVGSIVYVLGIDQKQPEGWMANRVSGSHEVGLISLMFNEQPATILPIVQKMHRSRLVEYDGHRIMLPKAA